MLGRIRNLELLPVSPVKPDTIPTKLVQTFAMHAQLDTPVHQYLWHLLLVRSDITLHSFKLVALLVRLGHTPTRQGLLLALPALLASSVKTKLGTCLVLLGCTVLKALDRVQLVCRVIMQIQLGRTDVR